MNRHFVCLVCLCMAALGCNESSTYHQDDPNTGISCDASYTPQCRKDNKSYTMCHEGIVKVVSCNPNKEICYNGGCVVNSNPSENNCDVATYLKRCENNQVALEIILKAMYKGNFLRFQNF